MPSWYKLSKIYVGADQVRPPVTYLLDYSTSFDSSDWWTRGSGISISWWQMQAQASTPRAYRTITPISPSAIKKITIEATITWSGGSWSGGIYIWLQKDNTYNENGSNKVLLWANYTSDWGYDKSWPIIATWWSYANSWVVDPYTTTKYSWTRLWKCDVDIANAKSTLYIDWTSVTSWTISSTKLSNFNSISAFNYIFVAFDSTNASKSIQDMHITVMW